MNKTSIQAQTVLYNNSKDSFFLTLDALANSMNHLRSLGNEVDFVVAYGDASPEPIFTDEEVLAIKDRYKDSLTFNYTFFNENTGTSKGQNKLLADCETEYVLMMNPDIIVNPTFFKNIFEPFDDPDVGQVEGRQTPIEHPKDYSLETGETSWASGAVSVFPRDLALQIGGLDEKSFFMYCDDVDFSWRIRLAGKKVVHQPKAVAFHSKHLSEDASWCPTPAEIYYSAEAALLLAHKWSNFDLLEKHKKAFKGYGEQHIKALEEFNRRERGGTLPECLDADHKVAQFIDGNYAKHRFDL